MLVWIKKSISHMQYLNIQVPRFIALGIKVLSILTSDPWIQVQSL